MNNPIPTPGQKYFLVFFRIVLIFVLGFSAVAPWRVTTVFADKLVCGVPGKDGPVNIGSAGTVVNTYYPGVGTTSAGATSITLGASSGSATTISAGDLLLVIQMQGAEIDSTNTGAYGDGVGGDPGSGNLNNASFTAGLYEYVVATNSVGAGGGALSISSPLVNSYDTQNYPVGAGSQGQRRFQVIRVPQYSSLVLSGSVVALSWNGSVGGVVALDVAGALNFSAGTINVSGQGFRGGGGIQYRGGIGANTDYRTLSTNTANASKGEGTAGTPRFIFNGSSVVDLGVALEGYPNGSFARGAPGNAGGGGTDGRPDSNDANSGGGGGGNGGAGGKGGFAWETGADTGGFGGSAFSHNQARLVMGGGGGAGTIDDNDALFSSGGAGGGLVMVRAGTVTGSGTINADGIDGQTQPLNDSAGGGGAGGSVILLAKNGSLPAGLNVSAQGGDGGDAWPDPANPPWNPIDPYLRHGPGGGGGGGVVYLSSTAAVSTAGGQNGISTTANDPYGAQPGSPGSVSTATSPSNVTTGISGAECIPTPSVVKTTSTPVVTQTPTGTTGEYTIVVSIPANQGTALGFTISDSLPTGFTYASTSAINLSGGAARISVSDPTAGTATPAWGSFDIPGGGQVQITFTVDIASTVVPGIYQNPATATYTDPTRTLANGTTNSQYDPASSTGEDIQVVAASLPDLTVTKANNVGGSVSPGSSFNWTIAVSNVGGGGAAFTNGQTIMSDALPGVAGYYPQGSLTVTNGATPPTGTINCTITDTTLACTASGTVTLPSNSSFSVTFTVTPTAGGDLVNTAIVDPGGIVTESNETNNTGSDTVSVLGADLSIVKDDGQTSYLAGGTVTYTVTVSNNGGASITGATVSDVRPANISTWAWACTSESNASGCTPAASSGADFTDTANLAVGGTIVYTVTANVVANPTGDLVNTATVTLPTGYTDTNPGNNSSTDTDTLTSNSVDLSILKDDGQPGYAAGGTVTYTVTVTNLGGADVTGVTVSDPRPANISTWAWACTSELNGASGCTPAGSSSADFSDTINLPIGGSVVYTVTANVVANPTGNLVNTATVTPPSGFADTNISNNSSTDTDTPLTANLSITKDDGRVSFAGGDTLTYTVTVVNLSGVEVTGAVVSDSIPVNIASWTWVCEPQGGGATGCDGAASNSLDFTDTVNLPVGGTIVYTVTAVVVANPTGNLVNTATVSLPTGYTDSDPTNNTSTDTDFQGPVADLSLNKTVDNPSPTVLTNITFTLSVTNTGPDPATGVEVTENLPNGFAYVSSNPSQGTYDSGTGVWIIGNMAVNQTVTLTITVNVNLTGSYINTAEISASLLIDPDSTPNNNNANEDDQDSVTIIPFFGGGPTGEFISPKTGFAPNTITMLNGSSRQTYDPTRLQIVIPVINLKTSIVGIPFKAGDWDVSWLQNQVGWLNGTSYPTWSGNSVLTAHAVNSDGRPGVFTQLKNLKAGEYIFVESAVYRYIYKVVSNELVQPDDTSVLRHEEKPWLTLVTCDTYDEKSGAYLLRVAVRAVLVDVREIK